MEANTGMKLKRRIFGSATRRTIGALALGSMLAAGTAQADKLNLRYDNGIPSSHVVNTGIDQFLDALSEQTSGDITATHYYGALQSVVEASAGLRENILDMGSIFPQYLPAEFPINNFVTELPGVANTSVAMTGANTEFVLLHCAPCLEEFTSQNQLPLIMFANPTYQLIMAGDNAIRTPEDVKGKKLRSGGNYFRAWIEHFGGVAVSVPGAEIFESMNAGIVDGTVGVLTDVTGFGIEELVSSVTMINVGAFHNGVFFGIRRNLWQELPEETRGTMLKLAVEGQALSSVNNDKEVQRVVKEVLPANDVEIIEPGQNFKDAQAAFIEEQIVNAGTQARDKRDIADALELAQTFVEITRKWDDLTAGIDATDAEQVAELYRDQIYSKLDIASFGM